MKRISAILSIFCFALLFQLGACSRKPASTADVPKLISQSHSVAVVPFSQPLAPSQLFTGQIPEAQGKISPAELLTLDRDLREVLYSTSARQFEFLSLPDARPEIAKLGSQPAALKYWIDYGEKKGLDYLLVPQVLDWHERMGSEAGVTTSASVRLEFFLLNIPAKTMAGRSIYEEKQVGLIDNIFTVGDFIKRKGQWVDASTLAREAMAQAVRDLGL